MYTIIEGCFDWLEFQQNPDDSEQGRVPYLKSKFSKNARFLKIKIFRVTAQFSENCVRDKIKPDELGSSEERIKGICSLNYQNR